MAGSKTIRILWSGIGHDRMCIEILRLQLCKQRSVGRDGSGDRQVLFGLSLACGAAASRAWPAAQLAALGP